MQRRSYSSLSAPPVVPPPLPDELSSARQHHCGTDSFRRHLLRDLSIGTFFLLIGLLVGRVGWLSANDSETSGVALSMQRPQLGQLTGVTLSSQAALSRDTAVDDADQSVAAVASSLESPATLDSIAKSASVDAPARGQPANLSSDEIAPTQQTVIHSSEENVNHTGADHTELPRGNVAELLWGIPRSSRPETLLESASPSSLLHAAAGHETCAESPMSALGTALNWADQPEDAYRIASEQHKLVFLIHVSGNFEIPGYT
jgi:hypothetical protein